VKGFKSIYANKTAQLVLLAGIFRVSQGYVMSQYTNAFFDIYSDYSKIFTIIQFVTIVVSSILSNLITGYLCDYLEKSYYFAKPSFCIAKAASGVICCIIIFIVHDNFWISITGLCLDYMLSKGWQPIAQSILRSVVNSNY